MTGFLAAAVALLLLVALVQEGRTFTINTNSATPPALHRRSVPCTLMTSSSLLPRHVTSALAVSASTTTSSMSSTSDHDGHTSKKVQDAIARIAELDVLVQTADETIDGLDEQMQLCGDDDELFALQKEKERIEKKIAKYLKEWDGLDELLEREGVALE